MANSVMFFGGPSQEMPKLYDGWFKKTQQIQKDIVAGAKSALRCVCVHESLGSRAIRVVLNGGTKMHILHVYTHM